MERKLAAIFSADVQGDSRLMGDDEEETICTLTAYRAVMTKLIQQHHGRVVDSPGDNLLAEFAGAVDVVQGAVALQTTLQKTKSNHTTLVHGLPTPFMLSDARRAKSKHAKDVVRRPSTSLRHA